MGAQSVAEKAIRESLEGRLPLLTDERIYRSFTSVLWSCMTLAAGTWTFLVGTALATVGSKEVGLLAYGSGAVIGFVIVMLSVGFACVRYGVDAIDATKSAFGVRGMIVPLVGLLIASAGASYIVAAMTATGFANVMVAVTGMTHEPSLAWLQTFGVAILVIVWIIASRGPKLFERLASYIGPAMIIISAAALLFIFWKFNARTVWATQLPKQEIVTSDKLQGFMLAFEWGVAMALTWWPFMGTVVARLAANQDHVLSPPVLAFGVLSPLFPIAAAMLGSVLGGTRDPTGWLIAVGGPVFGSIAILVVSLANLDIMVMQFYVGAIAVQQVPMFRRLPWDLLVAILVFPGIYCALRPHWVLDIFTTALTYGGILFAGIAAVTFVDYFVSRRQRLQAAHLFTASRVGRYYFWRGFNLVALTVVAFSVWFDLWMYDPVRGSSRAAFRYVGATLPTIVISGVMYYILTRLISIPQKKGGYASSIDGSPNAHDESEDLALSL